MRGELNQSDPRELSGATRIRDAQVTLSAPPPIASMMVPRYHSPRVVGLALAFACLGFVLGEVVGLSVAQGISQALLTGLLGFVGGVLLSYAGFRRVAEDGKLRLDPQRVAAALMGLSLGLSVGLPVGLYARCNRQVQSFFMGEQVAHSSCLAAPAAGVESPQPSVAKPLSASAISFGVQSGHSGACTGAIQSLNLAVETSAGDTTVLRKLVSELIETCGLGGT